MMQQNNLAPFFFCSSEGLDGSPSILTSDTLSVILLKYNSITITRFRYVVLSRNSHGAHRCHACAPA